MAKATTTIRQTLNYKPVYGTWFATNQTLFNQVAAFYFSVIQVHELVLELGNQEAMGMLEKLTHATRKNPHPVMPLSQVAQNIPAMFRRTAISTALGSARAFSAHLKKWRTRKEKRLRLRYFEDRLQRGGRSCAAKAVAECHTIEPEIFARHNTKLKWAQRQSGCYV